MIKILSRAGDPPRMSPSQLSDRLHLSSGAMTNRLDRLEAQGLIARLPDPKDRRGVLVELTAKGDEIFHAAIELQIEREKELCAPLTKTERAELSRLLRKLIANIEDAPGFPWNR